MPVPLYIARPRQSILEHAQCIFTLRRNSSAICSCLHNNQWLDYGVWLYLVARIRSCSRGRLAGVVCRQVQQDVASSPPLSLNHARIIWRCYSVIIFAVRFCSCFYKRQHFAFCSEGSKLRKFDGAALKGCIDALCWKACGWKMTSEPRCCQKWKINFCLQQNSKLLSEILIIWYLCVVVVARWHCLQGHPYYSPDAFLMCSLQAYNHKN